MMTLEVAIVPSGTRMDRRKAVGTLGGWWARRGPYRHGRAGTHGIQNIGTAAPNGAIVPAGGQAACDDPDDVPPCMQRELAAQLDSTTGSSPGPRLEHKPTAQPARSDNPALVPRRDQTGDLADEDPGEATSPEQRR